MQDEDYDMTGEVSSEILNREAEILKREEALLDDASLKIKKCDEIFINSGLKNLNELLHTLSRRINDLSQERINRNADGELEFYERLQFHRFLMQIRYVVEKLGNLSPLINGLDCVIGNMRELIYRSTPPDPDDYMDSSSSQFQENLKEMCCDAGEKIEEAKNLLNLAKSIIRESGFGSGRSKKWTNCKPKTAQDNARFALEALVSMWKLPWTIQKLDLDTEMITITINNKEPKVNRVLRCAEVLKILKDKAEKNSILPSLVSEILNEDLYPLRLGGLCQFDGARWQSIGDEVHTAEQVLLSKSGGNLLPEKISCITPKAKDQATLGRVAGNPHYPSLLFSTVGASPAQSPHGAGPCEQESTLRT